MLSRGQRGAAVHQPSIFGLIGKKTTSLAPCGMLYTRDKRKADFQEITILSLQEADTWTPRAPNIQSNACVIHVDTALRFYARTLGSMQGFRLIPIFFNRIYINIYMAKTARRLYTLKSDLLDAGIRAT